MDLIILSADIYTGDTENPHAEAIGIKDGKIAVLGGNTDVMAHAAPETEIMELPGKLVTPGLVDSHLHFVSLGIHLQRVDLKGADSLEACKTQIREAAAKTPKGKWIVARGWNNFKWRNQATPQKADLDEIAPDHPVMMTRVCGHSAVLNSRALEICGITKDTVAPSGGKIGRLSTGEPDGVIYETLDMVFDKIPPLTGEEMKTAVLAAQAEVLKYGITGVHSMEGISEWRAVHDLHGENLLKIRIYSLFPGEELQKAVDLKIPETTRCDKLGYGHCKLFADGSLGSSTALTHEAYASDPKQFGIAFLTRDELVEKITNAYDLGFNVAVHAIGDKAVGNVVHAIAMARQKTKNLEALTKSDRIEHVQLFKTDDLKKMKELGILASVQPVFLSTDWELAERQWGFERCENAYAWKTIQDMEIPLQFGSDSPVESPDPMLGIHAAYTRQTPSAEPENGWFPDQKLTLEEILRGFTLQPAITSGTGDVSGTLSVGKFADMTVFSKNLFKTPPSEWIGDNVDMTIVSGEVVFQK
ncbi:MAG: amidohydrolase family protein [Desulfobacteraceae bacterium]|nr:amidohydrolase family protein [Desulfobacteraceae bacterium]